MTRLVKAHPTPQPQQGSTKEPKTNASVPQQEEQTNTAEGKVITDYNPDVDCRPEGSVPEIEAVNEEEKSSDADYAKLSYFEWGHCVREQ